MTVDQGDCYNVPFRITCSKVFRGSGIVREFVICMRRNKEYEGEHVDTFRNSLECFRMHVGNNYKGTNFLRRFWINK